MQLRDHPAFLVDTDKAAEEFFESLTTGVWWDKEIVSLKPELANVGSEFIRYHLDDCYNKKLISEKDPDPFSTESFVALKKWSTLRASTCVEKLEKLPIVGDCIVAHRMIGCPPEDLRKELGIFWSFDFENWPDPYPLWSVHGKDGPTLVIEAMIPVDRVNWQTSLMCLMDWMLGDCEAELRVLKDTAVQVLSCKDLETKEDLFIPNISWLT